MEIEPGTRLIALLGDPVAHSLSPRFQNAAIRAAGLAAVYLALRCDSDHLPGLLRGIAAAGGAGNVTLPHKERAAQLVERTTDAVDRTRACNTFWVEGGRLHGDNTDVEGFAASARALIGAPAGARVLVLGAGGVARAAVLALLRGRADAVHVLNRNPDRARTLCDDLDPAGRRLAVLEHPDRLRREGYDLIVNATPAGLQPDDDLPLDFDRPVRIGAVLDLAYRRDATAWVRSARARGIPAADGTDMLVHQGAAAFRRWFRMDPDLAAMRRALDPDTGNPRGSGEDP
jgi:shikimate dehydrogenase